MFRVRARPSIPPAFAQAPAHRRHASVRNRLAAAVAGLLAVVLLPQAAAAVPAAAGAPAARPAAGQLTLDQLIQREQLAEAERERRLLADGPIDDFELNRMLIQDLADYDEDAEVRAAAAEVLLTGDPVEFAGFLDKALDVYRAAADERRKQLAAARRELVQKWAETGGPIVRERAAAVLATKNAGKIADFVAIGHAAAKAADAQTELNAAEQAKLTKARVEQIVANAGYEVTSAGQAALDSEDPTVIAAFYQTGYSAASKRDTAAQTQIEAALAARAKAAADLNDLATRSTQAAGARTRIITASVAATKSLTVAANSMGLVNKYAKQGDAIYAADLPIRKAGGQTHTADLTTLRAAACAESATTARNADQVSAQAGVAETAAQTLVETGLSHGVAWAEVIRAQQEAGTAAKQAAETGCHAAAATEAAGKALDADRNATVQADNAVKYRQAAQREQAAAAKLADQAEKLAAAALAAEADARKQRLRAEQDARDAWAKADEAEAHYRRAVAQRTIARQQMSIAVAQQAIALDGAKTAVAQQKIAVEKGIRAKAAADQVNISITTFDVLILSSQRASARAQQAIKDRDSMELARAAADHERTAKAGTAEGEAAAKQVAILDAQLPGARTAVTNAKTAAGSAAAAAEAAAAAARAAAAAAAAAAAEARAAANAAADARREAVDAAAAANRAITDAQKANEYARQAVNIARAAINHATAAKADAELTLAAADNAVREAGIAAFQSRVAGRAATDARVAAYGIADPAATAIDVASAYAETDNDAAMAIDIANSAVLIGATHSASAQQHAADADAAAAHAAEQALRAHAQVKPAYEAAEQAAKDAARAIRASKAAIEAAIGAAKEAKAAVAAANDAAEAAREATAFASGAERMAVEAGHDSAVARQASITAKGYSDTAAKAAANAGKIVKQIEAASVAAHKFADSMKLTAAELTRIATETRANVPKLDDLIEAEKKARLTSWMRTWEAWAKEGDDDEWLSQSWIDFLDAETKASIEMVGGVWLVGMCTVGQLSDSSQPDTACALLKDGIKELIKNPGSLIHLKEWQNGEYAEALGMSVIDLATMGVPKVGKVTAGVNAAKDGLKAAVAKLVSGELLAGLKNFGAEAIQNALGKLGAINIAKLIELDVDLPKKLTFSADEISALKLAINTKGIDSVEGALRGITDSSTLDTLTKLLDDVKGLDLLRACLRNSFAGATPVLLADGTGKPIQEVALGDLVLATDPRSGVTAARPVTELHANLDTELADVTVRDGAGVAAVINTTQHHAFWNDGTREWTDAARLRPGDSLRTPSGAPATVAAADSFSGSRTMYNLSVAGLHTYYVLAAGTPVLVHNTGGCKPLGLGNTAGGTAKWADTNGYLHYMGEQGWKGPVKRAIDEGEIEIQFNLRAMNGVTPMDRILFALDDGINGKPYPYATSEEMTWIGRAIYHKKRTWDSVVFHNESGVVNRSELPEPKWDEILPHDFLYNDLWLKTNGLRPWD
jgi:hypothetical protein